MTQAHIAHTRSYIHWLGNSHTGAGALHTYTWSGSVSFQPLPSLHVHKGRCHFNRCPRRRRRCAEVQTRDMHRGENGGELWRSAEAQTRSMHEKGETMRRWRTKCRGPDPGLALKAKRRDEGECGGPELRARMRGERRRRTKANWRGVRHRRTNWKKEEGERERRARETRRWMCSRNAHISRRAG